MSPCPLAPPRLEGSLESHGVGGGHARLGCSLSLARRASRPASSSHHRWRTLSPAHRLVFEPVAAVAFRTRLSLPTSAPSRCVALWDILAHTAMCARGRLAACVAGRWATGSWHSHTFPQAGSLAGCFVGPLVRCSVGWFVGSLILWFIASLVVWLLCCAHTWGRTLPMGRKRPNLVRFRPHLD